MPTTCSTIGSKFSLQDLNNGTFYFTSGAANVMGFNISFGIGDNSSTLSLDVTGDPNCDGATSLLAPKVGFPVMFRSLTTGFYFGGIVNNVTYSEGNTGFKYTLKINDPTRLLDNVTVLLKNYYCPIKDCNGEVAKNFLNVPHFIEGRFCGECPEGDDYENFPKMKDGCPKFGESGVNFGGNINMGPRNNGVSLYKMFSALQAGNATVYTTHGSDQRKLTFDFSELLNYLGSRGRFSKTTAEHETLATLIETAANDCACDHLLTIEEGAIIKVWMLDRRQQTPSGQIQNLINLQKTSKRNVISNSVGIQEIYSTAHKVIIGDNISYLKEIDVDFNTSNAKIYMFFGYTEGDNPQPIMVEPKNFVNNGVTINIGSLSDIFSARNKNLPRTVNVTEKEMLFALKSQQSWMLYGLMPQLGAGNSLSSLICNELQITNQFDINKLKEAFNAIYNNNAPPNIIPYRSPTEYWKAQLEKLKIMNGPAAKQEVYILFEQAWTWFQNLINTYYGKKFLVDAGNICITPKPDQIPPPFSAYKKGDGGFYELSDVPEDSGYPSKNQLQNGIKGLQHPRDTQVLQTQDGKINGFVVVDLGYRRKIKFKDDVYFGVALEEMTPDSYFSKNININQSGRPSGTAYIKISVEKDIHYKDNKSYVMFTLASPLPMTPDFCVDGAGDPVDLATCANQFLTIGIRSMAAIFGKEKFTKRANDQGYTNIAEFNNFSLGNATGAFTAVVLPLKSMYYSYGRNKDSCNNISGPFIGSQGVVGKTELTVERDLNPWSYGGYAPMETAGALLALNGVRSTNTEESGEMQIAEEPGRSISWYIRNYGLVVSNINVSYGASGATTQYSFCTKLPKYANYAGALTEQYKRVISARAEVQNYINDVKRNTMRDINSLFKNIFAEQAKTLSPITQEKTPVKIIIGGYYDVKTENNANTGSPGSSEPPPAENKDKYTCEELCEPPTEPEPPEDGEPTIVRSYDMGIDKIVAGSLQIAFSGDEYKTQVMMSMDGLLAPVSIKGRVGEDDRWRASRYFDSWKKDDKKLSKPRPSMPPLNKDEKIIINQKYLNPILNKHFLELWDDRKGSTERGCNIKFLSFNSDPKDLYDEDAMENATDFGFHSLRGPLVLQSWGYDTEGKPIPNAVDSPDSAEKGIFQNKGLKNKFMNHWIKNPMTWPVGPIDLRFDRDRGVWVSPAHTERVLVAQLIGNLSAYGKTTAILTNPTAGNSPYYENYDIWGKNGENLFANMRNIRITVYDFLGRSLCKDTMVYVVNVDGKYIVLESSAVNQQCTPAEECVCTTTTETTTTETTTTTTETTTTTTETTTETTETTTETTATETCPDICGLLSCFLAIGEGPGVIGLDENNCLTMYCTPNCTQEPTVDPTPEPPPDPNPLPE